MVNVPPRYLAITLNDIDEARAALLVGWLKSKMLLF